jgi:FkbM family methyltransferase
LGAEPAAIAELVRGHKMLVDCRLQSHARALFTGNYDDDKVDALARFVREGGTVLDVGANIGFYTVPLALTARLVGADIVAAEPFAKNAEWLRRNLVLNGVEKEVTLLECGLSSESRDEQLALREDFETGASIGNASVVDKDQDDAHFKRVKIRLEPLDLVWPSLARRRLDAVKLDIEGHEDRFFEGASQTLRENRPVILMEINRWFYARRGIDFDSRIAELLPSEYQIFEVTMEQMREIAGFAEARDTDVLLVPREKAKTN